MTKNLPKNHRAKEIQNYKGENWAFWNRSSTIVFNPCHSLLKVWCWNWYFCFSCKIKNWALDFLWLLVFLILKLNTDCILPLVCLVSFRIEARPLKIPTSLPKLCVSSGGFKICQEEKNSSDRDKEERLTLKVIGKFWFEVIKVENGPQN